VSVTELGGEVPLPVRPGQPVLTLGRRDALLGRLKIGPQLKRPSFKVEQVQTHGSIREAADGLEIGWKRVIPGQLAQTISGLHQGHLSGGNVSLELEQLQLRLQEITFADTPRLVLILADCNGILETLEVLVGELQRGLGQQNLDELLRHVVGQRALGVAHLRDRDGRLVARRPHARLPLVTPFNGVGDAYVKLGNVV
jgi:hypothetical protein